MNAPVDFNALKTRQQTAWASGDYAVIGTTLQLVGELLAEACDLRCDELVLDGAAGNGNATLAALLGDDADCDSALITGEFNGAQKEGRVVLVMEVGDVPFVGVRQREEK